MSKSVLLVRIFGPVAFGYGAWVLLKERGNNVIKSKFGEEANQVVKADEKSIMVITIFGKGSSDLSTLREETSRRRLAAADAYYKEATEKARQQAAKEKADKENS